jgi:sigma-B regulation protein RsbU (phosphoserine phosphatase)
VAGFFPNAAYRCLDVPLRASDSIIIYSDGITEYENRAGEQFGEARLRALLARSPVHSAEETCAAIAGALDQFGQGRPFNDDVTMLVAKIA